MAVRSERLAVGTVGAGLNQTIYTCPSERTALVKDIRLSSPVGTVTRAVLFVASGAVVISLLDVALGTGLAKDTGFVVLQPGDRLGVFSAGSTTGYWVSGAELTGVSP